VARVEREAICQELCSVPGGLLGVDLSWDKCGVGVVVGRGGVVVETEDVGTEEVIEGAP